MRGAHGMYEMRSEADIVIFIWTNLLLVFDTIASVALRQELGCGSEGKKGTEHVFSFSQWLLLFDKSLIS